MKSLIKKFIGQKSVPFITVLNEETREGVNKSYIPRFLWKPPFGYPRFADLPYVRWLATTPYVQMCVDTIIEEITSIEHEIIPNPRLSEDLFKDSNGDLTEQTDMEIAHIKSFLENPNTNDESFEDVFIKPVVRDILEVNSGVLNKVFNLRGEMVEVVARDGITFTKNPDVHGMFTHREEIIIPKNIIDTSGPRTNQAVSLQEDLDIDPLFDLTSHQARERAAYFQFGWIAGPKPTPFGKREIVWLQKSIRSDDIYGISPVQYLSKTLQMLLWQTDSDLEYYNNNNVPKGMIGLDGSDMEEIKAFKEQWKAQQHELDEFGNKRKIYNSVPILNMKPMFTRIEFSSSEMEIIEKQKWYTKMVWASFGVTPTELGYSEDSQGQANQIVQSKVFRKKAINPLLRTMANKFNSNIISEFEYTADMKIGKDTLQVPKYIFRFKLFDTDEERQKYELYKLQTSDSGIKTINEIRSLEGLDPVDWGDEDPRKSSAQNSFSFGGSPGEPRSIEDIDDSKKTQKIPGTKQPDENLKKTEKELDGKSKKKDEPFINQKESEEPDKVSFQLFADAIKQVLDQNEDKLKQILDNELQNNILDNIKSVRPTSRAKIEVKSIMDVIKKIASILGFGEIRQTVNEFINNNFLSGFDDGEKEVDSNFVPDQAASNFLANHTFNNVKGMTDDLTNKLRAELERGVIAGEGVDKLKARVSNVFKISKNRAEMIARTETARAFNMGKLQAVQKSGKPAKKYIDITLDKRTSQVSKAMDRKYGSPEKAIPLDQNFSVSVGGKVFEGPAPPFMPNDRDIVLFTFDIEEEEQ